jgi:hypothetical protein
MSARSFKTKRYTSSALMWRWPLLWNNSKIVSRGKVALRPVFFKFPWESMRAFHVQGIAGETHSLQ